MKKSKKWLPLTLALAILLGATEGTNWTVAAKDSGNDAQVEAAEEKSTAKIKLSLGNGQKTPQYKAGQSVDKLEIKVTNQGSGKASDVSITPEIDKVSEWPFEISDWNYERGLGEIGAGQNQTAVFEKLTVRNDVESKTYTLKFLIEYTDENGTDHSLVKNVYVKTSAQQKEESDSQGNTENQTSGDSGSVDDTVEAMAGSVSNGEVYASDGGSTSTSVPRVIVSGFTTEPGDVNAGSNFKLTIHVTNTSKTTAVSNMLFDLQAPSAGTEAAAEAPAFLPVSGSSSIYLEAIPAGGTKDISIDLNARADLVQKPYSITLTMKYEDGNGTQYDSSSSLAIPVKQAARFEFSELELSPSSIQVGEEANVTCSLYNTGRVKLYNVKANFEGEGIEAQQVFVGNVDSGATGNIDAMVTAVSEMSADTPCKMVVTYEDESGNQSTKEEEFTIEVLPEAQADTDVMVEQQEEEKSIPWLLIVILILVITAAVAAVLIIRKKKKKKDTVEEEELMDEVDRFTEDE